MQSWCSKQNIIQKEQISLDLKAWEMMEEFKWDGNWWRAYHQTYLANKFLEKYHPDSLSNARVTDQK